MTQRDEDLGCREDETDDQPGGGDGLRPPGESGRWLKRLRCPAASFQRPDQRTWPVRLAEQGQAGEAQEREDPD
jgi:hypothetical protein